MTSNAALFQLAKQDGFGFAHSKRYDVVLKSTYPNQALHIGNDEQSSAITITSNNIALKRNLTVLGDIINPSDEQRINDVIINGSNIIVKDVNASRRISVPTVNATFVNASNVTVSNQLAVPTISNEVLQTSNITSTIIYVPTICNQEIYTNRATITDEIDTSNIKAYSLDVDNVSISNALYVDTLSNQKLSTNRMIAFEYGEVPTLCNTTLASSNIFACNYLEAPNIRSTTILTASNVVVQAKIIADEIETAKTISTESFSASNITSVSLSNATSIATSNITSSNATIVTLSNSIISTSNIISSGTLVVPTICNVTLQTSVIQAQNRLVVPTLSNETLASSNIFVKNTLRTPVVNTDDIFAIQAVVNSNVTIRNNLIVQNTVSASNAIVNALSNNNFASSNALITTLQGNTIATSNINVMSNATISNITSSNITASNIFVQVLNPTTTFANTSYTSNSFTSNASISNATITTASLSNLTSSNIFTSNLSASNATALNILGSNATLVSASISNLYTSNLFNNTFTSSNVFAINASLCNVTMSNITAPNLNASNINVFQLNGSNATINTLIATTTSTSNLNSSNIYTSNIFASNVNINQGAISNLQILTSVASNITVNTLSNNSLVASNIVASNVTISNINVISASLNTLSNNNAAIVSLSNSNLASSNASIQTLQVVSSYTNNDYSSNVFVTGVLNASNIAVSQLTSSNATVQTSLTVPTITSSNISTSNITSSNSRFLYVASSNLYVETQIVSYSMCNDFIINNSLFQGNVINTSNIVVNTASISNIGVNKAFSTTYAIDAIGDVNIDGSYMQRGQRVIGWSFNSNTSNQIFITSSNVGIGTNNPLYPLDVAGNINFTGNLFQNGQRYIGSQWTTNSNTSNQVFIMSSNIGIGLSNPQYPLDVAGNINFSGDLFQKGQRYIGSQWITNSNTSNQIFIMTSNVGIGVSNPQYPLDVAGNINFTGNLFQNGSRYIGSQWTTNSNTSNEIYILSSNVGIGTVTPRSTLDVNGAISLNSNIIFTGTSSTPFITWSNEPNTGLYREFANTLNFKINNNSLLALSNNNVAVTGNLMVNQRDVKTFSIDDTDIATISTSMSISILKNGPSRYTLPSLSNSTRNGFEKVLYNYDTTRTSNAIIDLQSSSGALTPVTLAYNQMVTYVWYNNAWLTPSQYQSSIQTDSLNITGDARIGGNIYLTRQLAFSGMMVQKRITNNDIYNASVSYTVEGIQKTGGIININMDSNNIQDSIRFFRNSNTEIMRLTSNGFLGLGFSNPRYTFDVNGNINFESNIFQAGRRFIGWALNSNTSNQVFMMGSNVGIGLSNPAYPLDVTGNMNVTGNIFQNGMRYIGWSFNSNTSNQVYIMSSNVGIGLSNPSYPLDVIGNINFTGNLFQNGQRYIGSQWTTNSNTSNQVYIMSSNVGIGLSNPAYPLDVLGNINFTGNLFQNGQRYIGSQWTTNSNTSNQISITLSNVGIGTSNPTVPLEVASSNNAIIKLVATSNATNANITLETTTGNHSIYRHSTTNTLRFNNGTTDIMAMSNTNIGIGTTTPSTLLHVQGDTTINGNLLLSRAVTLQGIYVSKKMNAGVMNTSASAIDGFMKASGNVSITADASGTINLLGNTSSRLFISSTGNVGINTTSPSSILTIAQAAANTGNTKLVIPTANANDTWWVGFCASGNSADNNDRARIGTIVNASGNGALYFTTGPANAQTERMRIDHAGNVGIGITTPTSTLDVNGISQFRNQSQFNVSDTVTLPSISWMGDSNTGLYHVANGQIGVSLSGSNVATFSNNNLIVANNISASNLGFFRNRVINGCMRFDQRNSGTAFAHPSGGSYTLDMYYNNCNAGNITTQQVADAPIGFSFSMRVTANATIANGTSGWWYIHNRIEGYSVADFGFGQSGNFMTLSFWVKSSSVTGTLGVTFQATGGTTRRYLTTTTINAANTWERKQITIPVDTTSIYTDHREALGILFTLQAGTRTSTIDQWTSNDVNASTTASNFMVTGNQFFVTGIQLEKGNIATPFEYRPYDTELTLCQRYYEIINTASMGSYSMGRYPNGTANNLWFNFRTKKRLTPSSVRGSVVAAQGSLSATYLTVDTASYAIYIGSTETFYYTVTGPLGFSADF